jgi:hypothetical protein
MEDFFQSGPDPNDKLTLFEDRVRVELNNKYVWFLILEQWTIAKISQKIGSDQMVIAMGDVF